MTISDAMRRATRAHGRATVAGVLASFVVCLTYFAVVGSGYGGYLLPIIFWMYFGAPALVATFVIIGVLRFFDGEADPIRTKIYVLGAPAIGLGLALVVLAIDLHISSIPPALLAALSVVASLVAGSIMVRAPRAQVSWSSVARAAVPVAVFGFVATGLVAIFFGSLRCC
jgi:hypothetical protein